MWSIKLILKCMSDAHLRSTHRVKLAKVRCVSLVAPQLSCGVRCGGKPEKVTSTEGFLLFVWVRGRRQAHNPTLAKIMRLASTRRMSHTSPPSPACNGLWRDNRRALVSTRLGSQAPRSRQVSMKRAGWRVMVSLEWWVVSSAEAQQTFRELTIR